VVVLVIGLSLWVIALLKAAASNANRWLAETMNLYHGDCLEVLPTFPPASVEAIITDLPYGTTACEWDSIIPLDEMWKQVKRVLKVNGVFITTSAQPFTSVLVMSNLSWFRYDIDWDKKVKTGHLNAKVMPLRRHETILIFSPVPNGQYTYNPQMVKGEFRQKGGTGKNGGVYGKHEVSVKFNDTYYPSSILEISKGSQFEKEHPTQKPVNLFEYIINTYTNEGDTVLDFCFGSGTTGVAAKRTNRKFIGIEKEQKYFEIGKRRIAQAPQPLFTEPPRQPTQRAADGGNAAAQNELFG